MDEDTELENSSEPTDVENTETDNDSGTGEENNSDSENTGTDIPESDNNAEDENNESKKVYFSWNKTFNDETKSQPRRLPESVISDSIDQQKAAIANALGNIEISGVGGGGSDIDIDTLKAEIIAAVVEQLRPSGHVYPDTSLIPDFLSLILRPSSYTDPDIIYAIEHMDTRMIQNFDGMFSLNRHNLGYQWGNINLELDLRNWNMGNAKSLTHMFYNTYFKSLNLSGWDVRNVEDMSHMFEGYNSNNESLILNLDVSDWDVRNVQDMSYMFSNLGSNSYKVNIIDLSTWDLSYLKNHTNMFYNTYANGLLWGGALNAPVGSDYDNTSLNLYYFIGMDISAAEAFFNSLSPKTTSNEVIIKMPTTAQGADISIATNKGYTITGITQP